MKKAVVLILLAAAASACAGLSESYRLGNKSELVRDWDDAIRRYERAVIENPKEPVYRLALLRARASASLDALKDARVQAADGRTAEAAAAYKKALAYDPSNRSAAVELKVLQAPPAPAPGPEEDLEGPVRLKTDGERIQLKFTEAMVRSIFQSLGKFAKVNFLFDEQFRDVPLSIDLSDRTFEQALAYLCLASKNFYRVIDERTVIVVPDNPMKRMQYELNGIKTFYLSNIQAQDVQNSLAMMVRNQYKAPSIILDKTLNSVTLRDTPQAIALAEKLIRAWDRSPGEVIVDLEIMEVSRIRMRNLGLDLSSHSVGARYAGDAGSPNAKDGWYNLGAISLGTAGNFEVTLPTAYLDFLEKDNDTKIIAQPRLRGVGTEEIKYVVGQKVPIPQTTWSPIAAGGVNTQPVTSFQYQDVGIDVKMKPRIHYEGEVTLELEIKISSLGGSGVADIPILNTREIKNTIRLKDGETNLLAGLLRDEERSTLKGIAGLRKVPVLGALFSNSDKQIEQTDVILTLTPYIIRGVPGKEPTRPIWVDSEGGMGGGGGESLEEEAPEQIPEEALPAEEAARPDVINLSPESADVPAQGELRISVDMVSAAEVSNVSLNIAYDPSVLKLTNVEEGMPGGGGGKTPFLKTIDNASGSCTIGLTAPSDRSLTSGTLAVLVFQGVAAGETTVRVNSVQATSVKGTPVMFTSRESSVIVR